MEQAQAAYAQKRYGTALDLYEHAHSLKPGEEPLLGIARAATMQDDHLRAMRVLDELRDVHLDDLSDAQLQEVNALIERNRSAIAEITFDVMPRGATLYINARITPYSSRSPVRLLPGNHALEVEAPEFRRLEQMLDVRGGDQRTLRLELLPMTNTGAAPLRLVDAAVPANRVTRTVGGLRWTWVALGATALFFGSAGVFHVLAENELEERLWSCRFNDCNLGDAVAQLDDSPGDTFEVVSKISLGLGVAAAAATVILAIVEWPREVEVVGFLRPGPEGFRLNASF